MPVEPRNRTQQISLRLARLEELLEPPAVDALSGRFEERTGVERILDTLRARYHRGMERIQLCVLLDELPEAGVRARVDAALHRLQEYQEQRLSEQISGTMRDGFRALGKGSLFLLACLLISAVGGELTFLPDLLRTLISEGFIIAGWVGLWHPMELLLYEWWPLSRDRKLYRMLAEMSYSIEQAGEAPKAGMTTA
ncbi:MAG: hypothetical protein JNL61_00465 [Rhizobiaceae bacterium]|nr:hypothetical protein [Rhizobiaceae bacterium]